MSPVVYILIFGGALVAAFLGVFLGVRSQRKIKLVHEPLRITFTKRSPPSELSEPIEIIRCRKAGNIFASLVCFVFAAAAGYAFYIGESRETSLFFIVIPTIAGIRNAGLATRSVLLYRDAIGFRHFGREKIQYLADLDYIEVYNILNPFGRAKSFGYRFVVNGKETRTFTSTEFIDATVLESVYDTSNPNVAELLSGPFETRS